MQNLLNRAHQQLQYPLVEAHELSFGKMYLIYHAGVVQEAYARWKIISQHCLHTNNET